MCSKHTAQIDVHLLSTHKLLHKSHRPLKQAHADLVPPPCNWLVGMVLTYLDATPPPLPRPA